MTKFEEEVKRPDNGPITELNNSMQSVLSQYRKMRQYADYIEYKDEQYQIEIKELSSKVDWLNNLLDERNDEVLEKVRKMNESLTVVPKDVAEWIEILKAKDLKPLKNPETYRETGFTEEKLQSIVHWISEHQEEYMRAWLDDYKVEKQKLFYLKDELTGQFLAKDNRLKDEEGYFYWTGADPLTHSVGTAWKLTFTQQEIDSMQTGSYEKIEVTE